MSTLITSTAQIGTIKDAGGNATALTVDSTGRILQPAKPAFRARIANSSGSTGTTGVLVFETEDFDIGANYNNSTGIFTAPITGIYHIMFKALSATNASGGKNTSDESPYGDIQIDGTAVPGARFYGHVDGAGFHAVMISNEILQLTAGQEVRVNMLDQYVYSDATAAYDPVFQGYLLG